MKRLLRAGLVIFASCVTALLCFSFLNAFIPAADSVAHFRVHLLAALLIAALSLALLSSVRTGAVFGVCAVLGCLSLGPVFSDWRHMKLAGSAPVKLLQLNVLFNNATPNDAIRMIMAESPDIVTLQEISSHSRVIVDALRPHYPSRIVCRFTNIMSVAVLSRFPKAQAPSQGCPAGAGAAWLRLRVHGKEMTVASLHLHWPYPFRQQKQIDALTPHLRALPRPVLLAGDFNAAPWSHSVARINEATGTRIVGGLRFTLHKKLTRWGPEIGLPIDHVLVSDDLRPVMAFVGPKAGSDHLPVITSFIVRDEERRATLTLHPAMKKSACIHQWARALSHSVCG